MKLVWWCLTAVVIVWGWYAYRINAVGMHHHVDEAVLYVLLVPTFPAGLAAVMALSFAFMALHSATGLVVPCGPVSMTVISLLISTAGYLQWFHGVPKAWLWWQQRGGK